MAKAEQSEELIQGDNYGEQSQLKDMTYDPDQDPKEKRQIRRDLRQLLLEVNGKSTI